MLGYAFDDKYYYTICSAQKLFTWMGHDVNGLSFVKRDRGLEDWESLGKGVEGSLGVWGWKRREDGI